MDAPLTDRPPEEPGLRPAAVRVPAARYRPANAPERVSDLIAAEVPIALSYNGTGHVVMMASPADLHDFAVGFSIAEGMVAHPREIERVDIAPLERGIQVSIRVPTHRATAIAGQKRNLAGRTGCGLCGVTNIAQALRALPAIRPMPAIRAAAIDAALAELPRLQTINRETGAVHAAALADRDGRLILLREDVGRHNALDKMIGAALIRGLRPRDGFALVTSRCSMEMVQKAVTAGFPLLAAISAPTSLAIELANDSGLTLAAFARGKRFTLYANPEGVAP